MLTGAGGKRRNSSKRSTGNRATWAKSPRPSSRPRRPKASASSAAGGRPPIGLLFGFKLVGVFREPDVERAAVSVVALHPDASVLAFDHVLRQPEAEAGALDAVVAGAVDAHELPEHFRQNL